MRLFFGVELDEAVKAAAADVGERLRQRLGADAPDFEARWIAPENLHITIWFLGEVDDARADAVAAAFAPSLTVPSFELAVAGAGAFPPSGAPRVVWIGVRQGSEELAALYGAVGERLAPLGFDPERRGYTAHLTIARVKNPGRTAPRNLRQLVSGVSADCGSCRISSLTLFRSRLSPRGAAYERLLRVPLS